MKCRPKWNLPQNRMSLEMEYHSKWNVIKNEMALKMERHSN